MRAALIYSPLLIVAALDQWIKANSPIEVKNSGISFSLLADQPPIVKSVLISSIFLVLMAIYVYSMALLAKPVLYLRLFGAVFVGGALSNCLDRMVYQYVRDHWAIFPGLYFNFADVCMWLGFICLLLSLFYYRNDIWREDCLRSVFSSPSRSHRHIVSHIGLIVVASNLTTIFFSLSFLRFMNVGETAITLYCWLAVLFTGASGFVSAMFLYIYAQRIVGPIQALKRYLTTSETTDVFRMRQNDPLKELTEISLLIDKMEKEL